MALNKIIMKDTRLFLESIGMPPGDLYSLPTSEKRFEDGGQYRFEVPGIQAPGSMKALLETLDGYEIPIHRVTQTKGIWTLLDSEIAQMVEYADKWKVELILAIGPRATTDTSVPSWCMMKEPSGCSVKCANRDSFQRNATLRFLHILATEILAPPS